MSGAQPTDARSGAGLVRVMLRRAGTRGGAAAEELPAAEPLDTPDETAAAPLELPRGTRGQRIALGVGLVLVALLALYLFDGILAPFVAAGVIAYALDPVACRMVRVGIPRGAAALLLVLGLLALVLLFALLLYPLLLSQVGLFIGRIPQYVHEVQAWAAGTITDLQQRFGQDVVNDKLRDLVSSQAGSLLSLLFSTITGVIGSGFAIFNVLSLAVVTPVVAFYLLRDWQRIIGKLNAWLPRRYAGTVRAQAREVDRILSAWVRGQAMCCVLLAVYYALALTVAGLDLGLIVGMVAGVLSFIPYVGSICGGVAAIALAMAQFHTWGRVIVICGVLALGQILEGYVIYPRFLGDRVELPAAWVIFALFAGGAAFGFLGIMLAVPAAATIGVLCRYWIRRYLRSSLYLDPPPAS